MGASGRVRDVDVGNLDRGGVRSGGVASAGGIVLIVAAEVMAPLAPAWASLWLALTLPLALAAAGIRRGGMVVGVLVCEPLMDTAISIGATPDVGWSTSFRQRCTGVRSWRATSSSSP
jgi:hypothetical protein